MPKPIQRKKTFAVLYCVWDHMGLHYRRKKPHAAMLHTLLQFFGCNPDNLTSKSAFTTVMIGWDTIHAFAEYLHWVQLPRVWIREVSCHCQHIIRCLTRIASTNNPRRSLKAFYTLGLWGIFLGIKAHIYDTVSG